MKSSNGRINIVTKMPELHNLFSMYDKIPVNQCPTFREPTIGLWDNTNLSAIFFSHKNIQTLQNGIRHGVYALSHGKFTIGPQDCDSLKIIMRSIFLQHAVNQPTHISQQIQALNNMVLDYCVPQVYSEAQGYMKYLTDVSTIAVPLAHPVMETQNDNRTHLLKPWF
jgi:hypothetical protein